LSDKVEEVEIKSGESSLSFSQHQKKPPTPLPRHSLSKAASPETSQPKPQLVQDEEKKEYDPPWDNPNLSDDIRQTMKNIWHQGLKTGSKYGSKAGSLAGTISTSSKVNRFLKDSHPEDQANSKAGYYNPFKLSGDFVEETLRNVDNLEHRNNVPLFDQADVIKNYPI
jgi:hypothetical protein